MKIGFVLDDTLDTPDGVQQYVLTIGAWLSSQGHNVHYLVGQTIRTDIASIHSLSRNIKVKFNGNRMSIPLPASRARIRQLLNTEQFDILHVQVPYSPYMAQLVILAAPTTTAIIGTFHVAPHSRLVQDANRLLSYWLAPSLKRFDKIVSVSSAATNFALKTFRINTAILPNVVATNNFASARAFDKYANTPTIVFLGRLVPRKGCMLLLEATAKLRGMLQSQPTNSVPNFRVVICGKGPLEADLKAYAAEQHLTDIVEFVGFVSETDKARYLKSADVAVFPSTGGESFGIVLLEAMAAGHPVVLGADNPGYAAVLAGNPKLLFPVHDADALAVKMQQYLTDKVARAAALEWQAQFLPAYDVAIVGAKLVEIYRQTIASKNQK